MYLNEFGITGNERSSIKGLLRKKLKMEDLGVAETIFGIQIEMLGSYENCSRQSRFSGGILERFNMTNSKSNATPLPFTSNLLKATDNEVSEFSKENINERSIVGSLVYLAQCILPDLAFSVGVLSQHLERSGKQHYNSPLHLLKYLR